MAKTDNHNPAAKLALRRYFLRKYHQDYLPNVLDCCQGGGVMWRELRKEFEVATYWGVDLKPKKGRVKIDSVRILQQPGWPQDVIDVDTYGSPWNHWGAILENAMKPVTVFLTIGQLTTGTVGAIGTAPLLAMGFSQSMAKSLPKAFHVKLRKIYLSYCIAMTCSYGKMVTEAVEAESNGNARYVGVRLEPQKAAKSEVVTPTRPKRKKATKEPSHV